jgi:hypothetical protein
MSENRKAAEEFIIQWIDKIAPGKGANKEIYQTLFSNMSDDEFDKFMTDIASGESKLAVILPNFGEAGVTVENNLALAKELGHNFFQRIWIEGDENTPTYLTPIPYLVVDLPIRRQAQLLFKKLSVAEDNKVVDDFTGQPTGRSKASKISYPETQVMAAMGLDNCLIEFLKYRGGDTKGFDAMNNSISKTGGVSLKAIDHLAGGVESTATLKSYLTCMHLATVL